MFASDKASSASCNSSSYSVTSENNFKMPIAPNQ